MARVPAVDPGVAGVLKTYPRAVRPRILALRELIYETAASTEGVGPLTETLKWGEPAYLTEKSGSGTTIRIAWKAKTPERYGMYFHCQTRLVDTFRGLFPDAFTFEGNRAIVFDRSDPVPTGPLSHCVAMALTYHCRKASPGRETSA